MITVKIMMAAGRMAVPLTVECTPEEVESQNILIIMADDLRFSDLGCYGGEIKTLAWINWPLMDYDLRNLFNTARCWSTWAALLTGYYTQQIGRDNALGIDGGGRVIRPAWAGMISRNLKMLVGPACGKGRV
jgi:arylsulfatase